MGSAGKQVGFVVAAIGFVSGIVTLVAYWLPSSATWMNKHGFAAWPLAGLLLLGCAWAIFNWRRTSQELATLKSEKRNPVPEDIRLHEQFKKSLPRDSRVLTWLRQSAGQRLYRDSDTGALSRYVDWWRATDEHFIDSELERAYKGFNEAASDFIYYLAQHACWAPHEMQIYKDDILYEAYQFGDRSHEREIQEGLGTRADKVLEAYRELYEIGSRLGL